MQALYVKGEPLFGGGGDKIQHGGCVQRDANNVLVVLPPFFTSPVFHRCLVWPIYESHVDTTTTTTTTTTNDTIFSYLECIV